MVYPNDDVWVSGDTLLDKIAHGFTSVGQTIDRVTETIRNAKSVTIGNKQLLVNSKQGTAIVSKEGIDYTDTAKVVPAAQSATLSTLVQNPYVLAIAAFLAYKLIKGR